MATQKTSTTKGPFALRLKEALDASDLKDKSQADQARAFGIDRSLLNQWLSGRNKQPTYALAKPVADRLNVNVPWLLKGEGPMRPEPTRDDGDLGSFTIDNGDSEGLPNMTPQQQKDAMLQLMDYIPHEARAHHLQAMMEEAFREGWIKSVPDGFLADWSAKVKIDEIRNKKLPGTQ